MKHKGLTAALAAFLVFAVTLAGYADPSAKTVPERQKARQKTAGKTGVRPSVEKALKKAFPNLKYDTIRPTDIKGIYEITAGVSVGYFAPRPGYLIVGEIRGKEGINLTAIRREELIKERNRSILAKAKDLPLDKALKIGEGPTTVVEFTDPDCPYCRTASEFLSKRKDVTRYIFFALSPGHPDAENKVKYIFCAVDRGAAYEEAMTGKLDDKKYEVCNNPEVGALVSSHKDTTAALGIQSTPFFIIKGEAVSGADTRRLEELLTDKANTGEQDSGGNH